MNSIFREEKAQISVELIIVLAAVIAVVLVLVSQLQATSQEGSKKLEDTILEIEEYTYRLKGDVDRVTKEKDFLKDEIDRFRKKYGF